MAEFHPIQKLCVTIPRNGGLGSLLVASGPELSAISLASGRIMSQWPIPKEVEDIDQAQEEIANGHDTERPPKRRKVDGGFPSRLSRQASDTSEASVEIVAERKKGERRRPKLQNHKLPNISHLITTRDGSVVIAVTADDKTITVFELSSNGQLQVLSQRALPKRLCAIRLTLDEKNILAADKFGDVYAVPLHPSKDWIAKDMHNNGHVTFTPSATEYTVHTKGNLEALRQQRELKHFKQKKEGPNFECKLLLGHVSLLTDLAIAEGDVNGRQRPYILTADRDEHIRVSRGIPQAHIIEAYCLGHREFVSRLCVVPWAPEILIAGNGEPSLRTFEWQAGSLVQTLPLTDLDQAVLNVLQTPHDGTAKKMVVSGIWPIEFQDESLKSSFETQGLLVVALEGMPVLLTFRLNKDKKLQFLGCHQTKGNVLDVAPMDLTPQVLVSLDIVHKPYSVKEYRTEANTDKACLQCLKLASRNTTMMGPGANRTIEWRETNMVDINVSDCLSPIETGSDDVNNKNKDNGNLYSPVGEFLYGLENLRKKRETVIEEDALETGETPGAM